MGSLAQAIGEIPLAALPVAAALAAVGAQLGLLGLALRQRRGEVAAQEAAVAGRWSELALVDPERTRRWELAALLTPVLLAIAAAVSTTHARALVAELGPTSGPEGKAMLILGSVSGQLNAIAFGGSSLLFVCSLAVIALPLAVATRWRLRGLRDAAGLAARGQVDDAAAVAQSPGPRPALVYASATLLYGMGLLPLLVGVVGYSTTLIHGFALMPGQEPAAKADSLGRLLVVARIILESAYRASQLGLALAAVTVGVLWSLARSGRARLTGARTALFVGGAVVAATALYLSVWPLRAENAVAWPPIDSSDDVFTASVQTPNLRGPDELHRAPAVELSPAVARLDGRDVSPDELGSMLGTLARNQRLLHPNGAFTGEIVVACAPDTPAARLGPRLHEAMLVGFDHPVLAFVTRSRLHRPMFGDLDRVTSSGARVTSVDRDEDGLGLHGGAQPADGAIRLRVADFQTCGDLAARIADQRTRGYAVELDVHPPAARGRTP